MDWVQWYYLIAIILVNASVLAVGDMRSVRIQVVSLILGLPMMGRIFLWW